MRYQEDIDFLKHYGKQGTHSETRQNKPIKRVDRVGMGKTSVLDSLKHAGGTKYSDLIPTKTK